MPNPWKIEVYQARVQQWLAAADALPPGEERNVCMTLMEGYAKLVKILQKLDVPSDLACGSFAAEHAGGRVATVSIEAMRFLRPIAVGDEVSCYCSLEKTGETSVAVKVETWARSRGRGKAAEKVTEGVFTFVATDDEGHPQRLPEKPEETGAC